jgi:hypothetical protein
MPLDKSGKKSAVGRNIATEESAGRPRKQAIAIALSVQRKAGKKSAPHESEAGGNLKRHHRAHGY